MFIEDYLRTVDKYVNRGSLDFFISKLKELEVNSAKLNKEIHRLDDWFNIDIFYCYEPFRLTRITVGTENKNIYNLEIPKEFKVMVRIKERPFLQIETLRELKEKILSYITEILYFTYTEFLTTHITMAEVEEFLKEKSGLDFSNNGETYFIRDFFKNKGVI